MYPLAPQAAARQAALDAADALRTERQFRLLGELNDMAMDLARDAHARAKAEPTIPNKAAFANLARAVRQIFAIETWIAERRRTREAENTTAQAESMRHQRRLQSRRLHREIDRAIAAAPDFTKVQRFRLDSYLADLDLDDELDRPIPEILARICRTLGLQPAQAPDLADFVEAEAPEPEPRSGTASPGHPDTRDPHPARAVASARGP